MKSSTIKTGNNIGTVATNAIVRPDSSLTAADTALNLSKLPQKLPKRSIRWCNLTTTLWSLIVLDSTRSITDQSLSQFLQVIHWRAHGVITEEEFSVLYSEWLAGNSSDNYMNNNNNSVNAKGPDKFSAPSSSSNSNPTIKKKQPSASLSVLRLLLLDKNYLEQDLDLFIGMVIHEVNTKLINTTISFSGAKLSKVLTSSNLEVVSKRWLALSEELFFCLDTPGYGLWRFDEAFYFCACLSIGMQSWRNEKELEADLSVTILTACTLQFMREAGANIAASKVSSSEAPTLKASDKNKSNMKTGNSAGIKHEVTLAMFKKYLVKKNIVENDLSILLQHVRGSIEKIARIVKLNAADELYTSLQPIEHRGSVVGSPRLWQEAIIISSGIKPSVGNNANIPPIILFLLTDASRYLSTAFKAIEFPVDTIAFHSPQAIASEGGADITNPLLSTNAANEELRDNAHRIWTQFRLWSHEPALASSRGSIPSSSTLMNEVQRDPVFQLIYSILLKYKQLQYILNAALFDFCHTQFGCSPISENPIPNSLSILCAGINPSDRAVLAELGLGERLDEFQDLLEEENVIISSNPTPTERESNNLVVPTAESVNKGSRMIITDLEPEVPSNNANQESQSIKLQSNAKIEEKQKQSKISKMPLAEKRRSSLLQASADAEIVKRSFVANNSNQSISTSSTRSKSEGIKEKELIAPHQESLQRPASKFNEERRPSTKSLDVKKESDVISSNDSAKEKEKSVSSTSRSPSETIPANSTHLLASQTKNNQITEDALQEKQSQERVKELRLLSEEESRILTKLLVCSDSQEQAVLIEGLRNLRLVNEKTHEDSASAHSFEAKALAASQLSDSFHFDTNLSSVSESAVTSPGDLRSLHGDSAASEVSSSTAPSSIAEMLKQGQNPGKYAAMLREILRKMSREDSQVRLRSLEQVLQLGQNIVQQDLEEKKRRQMASPTSAARIPTSQQGLARSPVKNIISSKQALIGSNPTTTRSGPKAISRSSNVPGFVPEVSTSGRKPTKVFGHPVAK